MWCVVLGGRREALHTEGPANERAGCTRPAHPERGGGLGAARATVARLSLSLSVRQAEQESR